MALYSKVNFPLRLEFITTTATGDGKEVIYVPFNCTIHSVQMTLATTGASSGNTDVTVYYTKPTGGVSTTGDLWTVATGVGRIAYNGTQYLRWLAASCAYTKLEAGGTLSLNIDAVAGTEGTNLAVTIWVYPVDD